MPNNKTGQIFPARPQLDFDTLRSEVVENLLPYFQVAVILHFAPNHVALNCRCDSQAQAFLASTHFIGFLTITRYECGEQLFIL